MKYTIISDSSCDLFTSNYQTEDIEFFTVPISIVIDGDSFCDENDLDTKDLIAKLKTCKNFKTACPNPEAFVENMRGKENVIIVTISSKLSGTFNSAVLAEKTIKEEHPDANIFVLDSLTSSGGIILILERLKELIEKNLPFKEITEEITKYRDSLSIRFVLQDLNNLVKTGRMGKLAGKVASLLTIKLICGDNKKGEIKVYGKTIGHKKAMLELLKFPAQKFQDKKDLPIVITHCFNEEDALFLKERFFEKYGYTNIRILKMRGATSVFANDKGLALSY